MKPVVAVSGILDTKGKEIQYMAERIRLYGCDTLVIEFSLGKQIDEPWVDISLSRLLEEVGKKPEDIFSLSRGEAALVVTNAAAKLVGNLYKDGRIHGFISYCGGMGSSISSKVMQILPLGFPKILLSTMLHNSAEYIGEKDVAMMYPVTESGLNRVSRQILNTAAGIVAGGSKAYFSYTDEQSKPLVAVSMQGVTTPCAQYIMKRLDEDGEVDGMIFHANGEGGKTMEAMISEGYFSAVADTTLGECSAHLLGGINNAGPGRMSSAASNGIPQIMSPGSVDFSSFRNRGEMGDRLNSEIDDGIQGRRAHFHNTYCTICTVTPDEAYGLGMNFAKKLNCATAPVSFFIPMRGWSAYDIEKPDIKKGWAGPGAGPSWIPSEKNPRWSFRAERFTEGFLGNLKKDNQNIQVYQVDLHINDSDFNELMYCDLRDMLKGKWHKGKYEAGNKIKRIF